MASSAVLHVCSFILPFHRLIFCNHSMLGLWDEPYQYYIDEKYYNYDVLNFFALYISILHPKLCPNYSLKLAQFICLEVERHSISHLFFKVHLNCWNVNTCETHRYGTLPLPRAHTHHRSGCWLENILMTWHGHLIWTWKCYVPRTLSALLWSLLCVTSAEPSS